MRRLAIWMALALALGMGLSGLALAQEPEDTFAMSTRFPVMRGVAGTSFDFDVDLKYEGRQARTFELRAQGPPDWTTMVKASFPDREISAVRIDANRTYPETIKVSLLPPIFKAPEPGEYTVTLEAKAGTLADKLELKAVVTARYGLTMTTGTGRLNTTATAGKDSVLTLFLRNTGTERLDDISLSADKPEDWSIAFKPEKVSVGVGDVVTVEATIRPHSRAIAGDYMTTLRASTGRASDNTELRVTVLVPTIWGWVGVGIAVLVLAGLVGVFFRLGRR